MSKNIKFYAKGLAVLGLTIFIFSAPALAVHPDEKSEIENLKKRIESLEKDKTAVDFGRISEYVNLSGVIEAEASYVDPESGEAASDLVLATAELSIEANLSDNLGGHVTLLYEEGDGTDEDLDVDEAVISLTSSGSLAGQTPSLHAGRMYVPFGMFNSYMISDPLTLELGETRDTAVLLVLDGELWSFGVGAFNGEADVAGDEDHVDDFIAALQVTALENVSFGVSYISDLAESDNGLVQDTSLYTDDVAGFSAFASAEYGQVGFEAEYLAALDEFDAALVGLSDLTGREPEAFNLEIAWMVSDQLQLAARYEEATDFLSDLSRYGATVSYGVYENAVVALEYLHADPDAAPGSEEDVLTAQLALEF